MQQETTLSSCVKKAWFFELTRWSEIELQAQKPMISRSDSAKLSIIPPSELEISGKLISAQKWAFVQVLWKVGNFTETQKNYWQRSSIILRRTTGLSTTRACIRSHWLLDWRPKKCLIFARIYWSLELSSTVLLKMASSMKKVKSIQTVCNLKLMKKFNTLLQIRQLLDTSMRMRSTRLQDLDWRVFLKFYLETS